MKILVINSGSSSIKYRLFDMTAKIVLASGVRLHFWRPWQLWARSIAGSVSMSSKGPEEYQRVLQGVLQRISE